MWQRVVRDQSLLDAARDIDAADVSAVARLRKRYDAVEVSVALELSAARRKAEAKFGNAGRSIAADVQGVEQASGGAVADYKATRMVQGLGRGAAVVDACCGIGGDAMSMTRRGLDVTAVDREPVRSWMAVINTQHQAKGLTADLGRTRFFGRAVHIDPARRDESSRRRAWQLANLRPSPETIGRLIDDARDAALKLSPGVNAEALPWPGELEFVNEAGRLVQAVLWTGRLASATRRATRVGFAGEAQTLSGEPGLPPIGGAGRYVYAVDPSVERAELLGQLCEWVDAAMLHPKLGLIASDRLIRSPWLTGFDLIERLPWRPKRIKAWLAANDGGLVEVKTRGKACDPDREQQRLRGEGSTCYTVFVLRFDEKVEALLTRRL